MLSFKKGKDIAMIKGGKYDKKILKIYDDNFQTDNENRLQEFIIPKGDKGVIFPLPRQKSERLYISAPSGAGKSTFVGKYLKLLLKGKNKDRPFFLFSRVEEDKPLDKYDPIRIPLTRGEFNTEPLDPLEFEDSIIVFDDIDTLADKGLLKYIQDFRDDLLECGRHYGITTISTTHQILNFNSTRTLLNEAQAVVIFPRCCGNYQMKNFLERYMGFDKDEIDYVKKLPTRWLYLYKEYPLYMIWNKGVKVI